MARFDRMDNGSPAEEAMKARSPKVGRSVHDFSTSVAGNCLLGMLVPVDWFPVVPSETVQMSISGTVEFRNPTNRPILNGFRTYFHVRYNRLVDLWEGAKNFVDKGRSGNIDLQLPNCVYRGSFTNDSSTVLVNANTPMSLVNFFKMPVQTIQKKIGTSGGSGETVNRSPLRQFQASVVLDLNNLNSYIDTVGQPTDFLPAPLFFSYQRNWRDFYSPKNLLQNNKFWFPDNEDHFILSYSCTDAVAIRYEDEDFLSAEDPNTINTFRCLNLCGAENPDSAQLAIFLLNTNNKTPEPNNPSIQPPSVSQEYRYSPNLCGIKFVQFRGDRFTTSSPFPDLIRGDIPILSLTEDNFIRTKITKATSPSSIGQESIIDGSQPVSNQSLYRSSNLLSSSSSLGTSDDAVRLALLTPESTVTMSDLYTLETLTAFKRKLGMTNGDYNEAVKAQFGSNPHVHSREATYIGGFYMDMSLSTVVQQSETSTTPLGTKAGNGLSAGSGNIGSFDVPDYGYITTYMFVVPNVYYTQGKYRFLSEKSSIELYFPIFNNLPAQAIRNDELYISGSPSTDSAPFSYEDRYAHYKSRSNFVCGFMGLPVSKARYDSAKIMARRFSSCPSFNAQFVSMIPENQDMNVFSVLDEPPLDFNVNVQVRRVFPGPYMAIEGSLSSPMLNA